jgi:hypothetical protein
MPHLGSWLQIGILLTTKRYKKCCFVDCSRGLDAIFYIFDLIFGLFDVSLLHKSAYDKASEEKHLGRNFLFLW